jgi:hypothetical protein
MTDFTSYEVLLFLSLVIRGCARNGAQEKNAVSQPEQRITPLADADPARLRDQRAVVERYVGNEDSKEKYQAAAGKLGTILLPLEEVVA